MNNDIIKIKNGNKEFQAVPIDLEFEHYLFEVYLNDRIENEIQRMMEYGGEKPQNHNTPVVITAFNPQ